MSMQKKRPQKKRVMKEHLEKIWRKKCGEYVSRYSWRKMEAAAQLDGDTFHCRKQWRSQKA